MRSRDRSTGYLLLTGLALVAAVYLIFQLLGLLFKLLFFVAVIVVVVWALRTWMLRE
jgi:hypothetical protein